MRACVFMFMWAWVCVWVGVGVCLGECGWVSNFVCVCVCVWVWYGWMLCIYDSSEVFPNRNSKA